MPRCCPPGRGCNAIERGEPCVLELCRAAREEPEAARAVLRWDEWQQARRRATGRAEWRFRRRAYERARENALAVLLMRAQAPPGNPGRAPGITPRRRPGAAAAAHATTRLRGLLRQYGDNR